MNSFDGNPNSLLYGLAVIEEAPKVTPWYPLILVIIFRLFGFPILAFNIHNILTMVSFASDPELQKNTRPWSKGDTSIIFSDSCNVSSDNLPNKEW